MADHTGIEWTDASWNVVVGCSLASPGCTHCYAMGQAARIIRCAAGSGRETHYAGTVETVKGRPVWTGKLALAPDATLTQPLRWKRQRRIFVNSMGDLFHEDVPDAWIDRVFAVMALAPQHTFQILTKRSARMRAYLTQARTVGQAELLNRLAWDTTIKVMNQWKPGWKDERIDGPHRSRAIHAFTKWPLRNVWLGVSAEDQRRADERIPDLLATPAAIRFVSAEPLLGPINLADAMSTPAALRVLFEKQARGELKDDRGSIHWIIVGGESGKGARPMHPDWARSIRDQCAAAGTAFFFKQWGEFAPCEILPAGAAPLSVVTSAGQHLVSQAVLDHADDDRAEIIARVGKSRAGRLLDGVAHDAFPSCSGLSRASTSSAGEARHG